MGSSARGDRDLERQLVRLEMPETDLLRGLEVQRFLAHRQALHHRVSPEVLIIAAVAERAGAIVWHYDRDFDRIAEVTGQEVRCLAPPGTL